VDPADIYARDLPEAYKELERRVYSADDDSSDGSASQEEPQSRRSQRAELLHAYEQRTRKGKTFTGTAWMVPVEEFGHDITVLLPMLQALSPKLSHFEKLLAGEFPFFFESKRRLTFIFGTVVPSLPPGFPVKIDIPIIPGLSASISFHKFVEFDRKGEPLRDVDFDLDPINMGGADLFTLDPSYDVGEIEFTFSAEDVEKDKLKVAFDHAKKSEG
jgi:GPCR-chaperone